MDTNSSSASSCGSDSGEDEAVVSVSRQHQDAFAFSQQGQTSPLPVAQETGSNSRMEEQQESWNCWNNNVVVGGYQHSSYSHSQQVANTAYREERGVCQQQQPPQQLNSTPSCAPSQDSQRQHGFNTLTASSGYSGPTNCVNNRAHLVSNLINIPEIHVTILELKVK